MERLVQQIQRDREKECTFKPQLVSEPEKHLPPSYRPVHLLVDAAVRSYSKHSAPTPPSPPFRPQLNARSRALAEQLAASAAQGLTRPTFRPRTAPEEHAFCPTIAPASAKLVEDSGRFPAEFGERQRFYERQRSQAARESALEALRALSFEPRTTGSNPAAVLALSSDRFGILAESAEERAQRMSVEEPRRQEERLRRRRAEEEGKLTFAPALDPRSRKIGRDSNLEELTSWQARARRQEERAAQAVAEREAQCTFRPRLVSQPWTPVEESERGPPSPGSKGGAPTRLLARARAMEAEKDRRQLELRRQAAEREEKECTFRPQLSSLRKHQQRGGEEECLLVSPGGGYEQLQAGHEGSRRPSSPTARSPGSPPRPRVAGLDAFMAHKARAEALKKAAEERRNEVFGIGVELRPARIGATVPRARALATEQRAALLRRFSVAEIEAARRAAECTFRPNLDKGTDRRRVLDQHSTPVAASSHLPGEEEDEWDFRSSEWGAAGAESVDRGVGRVGSERFGRRASLGSEACWEGLSASWAGARSAGDCVHGD